MTLGNPVMPQQLWQEAATENNVEVQGICAHYLTALRRLAKHHTHMFQLPPYIRALKAYHDLTYIHSWDLNIKPDSHAVMLQWSTSPKSFH